MLSVIKSIGGREKVDYSLNIGFDSSGKDLSELLYNILSEVLFVELIDYEVEVWKRNYDESISVGCDYFSIDIDLQDENSNVKNNFEIYNSFGTYHVDTDMYTSIQFKTHVFHVGWLKFLEVIGKLLNVNDKDLILEDDSTYPLLKRSRGVLIVNSESDEPQTWYMSKENLKLLHYPYKEEKITLTAD